MKKELLSGFTKTALEKAREKSPAICIGIAIAAAGAAIGATIVATRKAEKVLEEHRNDIQEIEERLPEEPTEKQVQESKKAKAEVTVKTGIKMVKTYIFVIILFLLCAISAITSHRINIRRQMALEAAFAVTSAAMKDKDAKIEELLGKKKAKLITDEAAKEKVKRNPPDNSQVIFTGGGDVLCYDEYSGRYFRSNPERIRKAVNDLNTRLRTEHTACLNEYYGEIDLPHTSAGDDLGWYIDQEPIEAEFSSMLIDDIITRDIATSGFAPGTPILCVGLNATPLRY